MTDDAKDEPRRLDPDEVACPRCHAEPGAICRAPSGRRADTIHRERRELAAATPEPPKPRRKGKSPGTRAGRSKAGKVTAARRRKDRDTVAAIVGQTRAAALLERARELGEDAVAFDRDRMALKRLTLDAALGAWATFGEAIEGYRRVRLDDQGVPLRIPREKVRRERVPTSYDDATGEPGGYTVRETREVVEELDVRGAFTPDDVKALATAAGIALDKVRLEEGSATSRSEHRVDGFAAGLRDLSDAELRAFSEKCREALDELAPPDEATSS